jgi:hypothetical protein
MRKFHTVLLSFLAVGLLAIGAQSKAQVVVGVGVGSVDNGPPTCQYGYYDYSPYSCVDYGYYSPDYFYNGVFIGVGPWRNYGYGHGWGNHRFVGIAVGHDRHGRDERPRAGRRDRGRGRRR